MMISVVDTVENIVQKGANAGNKHFLLFHNVFKSQIPRIVKTHDCVGMGKLVQHLWDNLDLR